MAKIRNGRMKATETVGRGSPKDIGNVPLVPSQSSVQSRSGNTNTGLVPVVDAHQRPLMPCKPSTARRLIKTGKATPFFKKGFFAIRLNKIVDKINKTSIVMAIDPGSKRTGITVATEDAVVFNIQCNTPDWIKKKMKTRRACRSTRRQRKTPYRRCRFNRKMGGVAPSIKARWQAHLRILDILKKIIPISDIVIEDMKVVTKKGQQKWNKSFSPLEYGKTWFEQKIANRNLYFHKFNGFETKQQRDYRGFKKTARKLANKWKAHCVDSHCLAEILIGNLEPVKEMYLLNFLKFNRRELHQGYKKGGTRRLYGSTRSLGFSRGTLIEHFKYDLAYIGGTSKECISLHNIQTAERLCQNAKTEDCKQLTRQSWRIIKQPLLA